MLQEIKTKSLMHLAKKFFCVCLMKSFQLKTSIGRIRASPATLNDEHISNKLCLLGLIFYAFAVKFCGFSIIKFIQLTHSAPKLSSLRDCEVHHKSETSSTSRAARHLMSVTDALGCLHNFS